MPVGGIGAGDLAVYGIPAVPGTASATARIRTGQDVRVDGDAGTVTLLGGAAEAPGSAAARSG